MEFEIFEHTADQGIIVRGTSLLEIFINAAKGLSALSTEPEQVKSVEEFDIEISRDDTDELLVAWLNELIFIQDTEGVFLVKFEIFFLEPPLLKAKVWGEKMDRNKHTFKSCLKAATYHSLRLEQTGDGWYGQVIFDV
ncbi:MAG TPA: archease [Candidatus Eremiobacteraeota bacterium]|nr:MAG: hypothetical protein BWY64_03732 [bacterium ADurb.Bin363]HPZ09577.1 archease [Candidatus Eremiobacteraeota bacterium]